RGPQGGRRPPRAPSGTLWSLRARAEAYQDAYQLAANPAEQGAGEVGGERSEMAETGQRRRLFGTDGVRGGAGDELTASLPLNLGVPAAAVLGGQATASQA